MNKSIHIVIVLTILATNVFGQRSKEDTLKSSNVYIIREYQPRIADAFKLSNNPKILDTTIDVKQVATFKIKDVKAQTTFKTLPIKPAKIKGEPLNKLYRAYLLTGFGNNATTRGELVINSLRSRKWDYGLKAWHHGSNGNVRERGPSNFSNTRANLYAKKFFYNKIVSANIDYQLNTLHNYGFNPIDYSDLILEKFLTKEETARKYQDLTPEIKFKTYYKDSSKINIEANFKFSNYTNLENSTENNTRTDLLFDRYFENNFAEIELFLDHNQFKYSSENDMSAQQNQNTIVGFKPRITTGQDKWELTVGVEGNIVSAEKTKFYVFPELYVKYDLIEALLTPYLGLDGGVERNNYRSLTQENPYLINAPLINNKINKVEAYGGLRGQFSSNSSYNLMVNHSLIDNLPLFVNTTGNILGEVIENQFDVIYDNAQITQLTAEFGMQRINRFSALIRADYFIYKLENQKKAWNMPDFKLTLSGRYDISDKLVFTGDIIATSSRVATTTKKTTDATDLGNGNYAISIGGIIDLNLGAEYFFSKRFSAFLRMYNLANQNYQYYNQYNVQGFTAVGGISYSFWGNKRKK